MFDTALKKKRVIGILLTAALYTRCNPAPSVRGLPVRRGQLATVASQFCSAFRCLTRNYGAERAGHRKGVRTANFRLTITVPPKLDVEANRLFQSGRAGSHITVNWDVVFRRSFSILVISGVCQPPKQALTLVVVKVPV